MNNTVMHKRNQVAIFGDKNANKSSLFYKLTKSNISISGDDNPIKKGIEFVSGSPIIFIDTANLIDESSLNNENIINTFNFLDEIDLVLYLIDKNETEHKILDILKDELEQKNIPYILVFNENSENNFYNQDPNNCAYVSLNNRTSVKKLIDKIDNKLLKTPQTNKDILNGLLKSGSYVIISSEGGNCTNCSHSYLEKQIISSCELNNISYKITNSDNLLETINSLDKVDLIITDDNSFDKISNIVPKDIFITSKSILNAVSKETIDTFLNGIKILNTIENGDYILIAEVCSRSHTDQNIGRIKIPFMIRNKTLKDINFVFASGDEYPEDLSKFKLVIHCGGCFVTNTPMYNMLNKFNNITSYGLITAYCSNSLPRALEFFDMVKNND